MQEKNKLKRKYMNDNIREILKKFDDWICKSFQRRGSSNLSMDKMKSLVGLRLR